MIYLASPYSHPESAQRELRYKGVCQASLSLNAEGIPNISPIAHWHPVAEDQGLETDANTWAEINKGWLARCSCLAILALPGWESSKGVLLETAWADSFGIPVVILRPEERVKWVQRLKKFL